MFECSLGVKNKLKLLKCQRTDLGQAGTLNFNLLITNIFILWKLEGGDFGWF